MSDIDERQLSVWLDKQLPGAGMRLKASKFPGGQSNPTYRLDTALGPYVLRRKPFGSLLPSAHAVEREYRLISALHPAGFPVARPVALCEDQGVIGSCFYVMEFVAGRSFWSGALPEAPREERGPIYEAAIDRLADLHNLDHHKVGLGDYGLPENYLARQIERWTKQYRLSQTDEIDEVERLIEWLPRTVPSQERTVIIHGDYRLDNLIFASDGPHIHAVIDWELSTLGDPLADFAYFAMNWVLPADGGAPLGGKDLQREGLPGLDEIVERYCARTGRGGLPDLHWYFAFNLFRLVGIIQGIKKRASDGNASNKRAAEIVARIAPLARNGWTQAVKAGA